MSKLLQKMAGLLSFIPNLFSTIAITLWTWSVMTFLLVFKGRNAMDKYHQEFMNAPPLSFEERRKWSFFGALIFNALLIYAVMYFVGR